MRSARQSENELTAVLVTHRPYKNRPAKVDFQKKSQFQDFNMFVKALFLGFIGLCYTQYEYGYDSPVGYTGPCKSDCIETYDEYSGKIHLDLFLLDTCILHTLHEILIKIDSLTSEYFLQEKEVVRVLQRILLNLPTLLESQQLLTSTVRQLPCQPQGKPWGISLKQQQNNLNIAGHKQDGGGADPVLIDCVPLCWLPP